MRAYKGHLKKPLVQLHVLSTTRKFLYKARIPTVLKTYLCLVDVSDVILPIIWDEIAQRLLFLAQPYATTVDTYIIPLNCVHISMTNPGLEAILEVILPTPDQQVELNQLIVPHRKKIDNQ